LDFTSNSTATVVFEKKASEQSHFQVNMTDGFGIAIEFKDLGDSPLELTDIPKGRILTVEMAGGNSSKIGDYGNETAPMLASALNDKHNMVCIDLLSAINDSNSTF
jgi:phosphosulfolactate phosphohydrolase-like enzyme